MKYGYGCLGFLSLLGILGIVTEERTFLAFFGFAVDFQYFFRKTDEMMIEYMNKSAARAFNCRGDADLRGTLWDQQGACHRDRLGVERIGAGLCVINCLLRNKRKLVVGR